MNDVLTQLATTFSALDAHPDNTKSDQRIAPELASYLPFIGASWSTDRPRVLVYGMAQNLAGHPDEVKAYLNTENRGLTRLHDKWAAHTSLGIKPWQTMHAQVVVAFAIRALERQRDLSRFTGCVTSAAAFTNVVKWASQKTPWERPPGEATDHQPPKATDRPPNGADYARAKAYVRAEVEILKPDLLIALGGAVDAKLSQYELGTPIVRVRHSAAQVLNNLRGVAQDLTEGPSICELSINIEQLLERWMTDLEDFAFRAGNDKGSNIQSRDQVVERLRKDWLYYMLAERRILTMIAG